MRKNKKPIVFLASYLYGVLAYCQPSINGPVCVVSGIVYQYNLGGLLTASSSSGLQVCISGGVITDRDQNKIRACTQSGEIFSSFFVVWNETSKGSITMSSGSGNKTFYVSITSPLQPGNIDPVSRVQDLTDTLSIPSTIQCAGARGGSCAPSYSYQWQRSDNALSWQNINGATAKNLTFSTSAKQTFYYRRKAVETGSGTIGYSDIATINVSW